MNKKLVRKVLNTSAVGDDLDSITQIDQGSECSPEDAGLTEANVDAIWKSVQDIYKTGTHPGISFTLRRQGKTVFNRAIGYARGNGPEDLATSPKVAMMPDTPVCIFSASKAVTALLIHILAEESGINLLDPVSYYLPEFAQNGKKNITIHQILSHRGGIPGIPADAPIDLLWDNDGIWRVLCEAKPITVDGSQLAYHAITGGYVLGRLVEKVMKVDIQTYLDQKIRQPMGMDYFTYGIDQSRLSELALNYATGPKPVFPISWIVKRALGADIGTVTKVTNDPRFQEAVIPAGNLVATAEEASRFFQMMLNDGVWQGKQICNPVTIRRSIQEFGAVQIDRTLMLPMRFSAGMMLGGNPVGIWGLNSERAYGHLGLINKLCWADPDRDISVSLLTTGIPIVGHHIPAMVNFVHTVSRECLGEGLSLKAAPASA